MNYLRPDVKRGHILPDEEDLILRLHRLLGNRWSLIAGRMPGRTDNDIKNYWNTHLRKKLIRRGVDPRTHRPMVETQDVLCSNPGDTETSEDTELENNNKRLGNTVDSRADLQEVASKVAIAAHCNEDDPATIPDPVTPFSDPSLITPTAAPGDFSSDISHLLVNSFVDEEFHFRKPAEHISIEQNVHLIWPSTRLEAANFSDDLWSIPSLSSQYRRFG